MTRAIDSHMATIDPAAVFSRRSSLHLTISVLARKARLSVRTVYRAIGGVPVRWRTVRRLARALSAEPSDLGAAPVRETLAPGDGATDRGPAPHRKQVQGAAGVAGQRIAAELLVGDWLSPAGAEGGDVAAGAAAAGDGA